EALELGAHEERLAQLVARERSHADAAIRDEGDEAERRQPAERLPDRRPADAEPLRELLLAKDGAGLDPTRDDVVLERERDVVSLRRQRLHRGSVYDCARSAQVTECHERRGQPLALALSLVTLCHEGCTSCRALPPGRVRP